MHCHLAPLPPPPSFNALTSSPPIHPSHLLPHLTSPHLPPLPLTPQHWSIVCPKWTWPNRFLNGSTAIPPTPSSNSNYHNGGTVIVPGAILIPWKVTIGDPPWFDWLICTSWIVFFVCACLSIFTVVCCCCCCCCCCYSHPLVVLLHSSFLSSPHFPSPLLFSTPLQASN